MLIAFACFLAVNLVPLPLELVFNHSTNLLILLNLATSLAIAWIGAKLLPGREWALALMYTVVTLCLTLPILWHLFFILPLSNYLPLHFRTVLIGAQALRQGIFLLGSLFAGQSMDSRSFAFICGYINNRRHSSIVCAAKSA
jgi:hypothetical protein